MNTLHKIFNDQDWRIECNLENAVKNAAFNRIFEEIASVEVLNVKDEVYSSVGEELFGRGLR